MERGTTTAPREETIRKLHMERMNLVAHIDKLQEQADAAQGGIRLYRNQRVGQFRERESDLSNRLSRIESGSVPQENFDSQVENLAADYRDTVNLAEHTFHQIASV